MQQPWHSLEAAEVVRRLGSDTHAGLSDSEARLRLERCGRNEIPARAARGVAAIIFDQFADVLIVVLLVAAVVSGSVGEAHDTIAIFVIVLLNAAIGAIQEYRAQRDIAMLRRMAAPEAHVLRGGQARVVPSREVVPGDIVQLAAGMLVPADLRLLEAFNLQADEAVLTGESVAVGKETGALPVQAALPAERTNMVFKGTQLTGGRGTGIVVATALDTELGHIAALLESQEETRTPLQQRLGRFGKRLAAAILAICTLIFLAGVLRGEPLVLMFLTAVSLAVAAVPEALPAVVTISLAFGARKLSLQRALVRHLPAVETLGSVTVICTDKTGTLTENRMQLERVYADGRLYGAAGGRDLYTVRPGEFWEALALSNDVEAFAAADGSGELRGEPTELALCRAAAAAGVDKGRLARRMPRVAELPFDSSRKCMTTLHRGTAGVIAFCKGAPETLLPLCCRELCDGGESEPDRAALQRVAEELAAQGYRVLAVARRHWRQLPQPLSPAAVECELTLLGLAALIDPPRPEAYAAVRECQNAGIRPVMITGDHPATALAIAARLGIADSDHEVITGRELQDLADAELNRRLAHTRVFARVSPEQKIRLVRALQQQGEFVAMTGDGINDAPALKQADIGIAMGCKGTDVAREAADMILLDDNFATIAAAVREGRRIFDNIRKFIKDTMSSNSGEIWTLTLAPMLGLPLPLLPIHILWINLVTDGLPGLAFAAEPAERSVMRRPPRPPGESIFAHGMSQHMIWVGLFVGGISIGSQAWALGRGLEHWQTVVFTVLTLSQLFHSLAIRSERDSLYAIGLFSNPYMFGAVLLLLALQLAVIYLPALNPIFHTRPLPPLELALCLALSSLVLIAVEVEKYLARRSAARRARSR